MKNENLIVKTIKKFYGEKVNNIFVDNNTNKIHLYLKDGGVDVIHLYNKDVYITSLKANSSLEELRLKLKRYYNLFLSIYFKIIYLFK